MSRKKKNKISFKIEKRRVKMRNWLAVSTHFRSGAGAHNNKKNALAGTMLKSV